MSSFYRTAIRSVLVMAVVCACSAIARPTERPDEPSQKAKRSGWLGVMVQDVTSSLAKREHLKTTTGAYVNEVVDESPADSAGLEAGDVIVALNGSEIVDAAALTDAVKKAEAGTHATVTVERKGEKKDLSATLGAMRHPTAFSMGVPIEPPRIERQVRVFVSDSRLGMEVESLNEQLAEYFGAPDKEGVLVKNVEQDAPAAKAGFKAGDVIIRVGKRPVDEVDIIHRELRKHKAGDAVEFEILRKGTRKILSYTVPEHSRDQLKTNPHFRFFNNDGDSFEYRTPGPDMQEFNIQMERMQRELRDRMEDMPKMIRKSIRISGGSDV